MAPICKVDRSSKTEQALVKYHMFDLEISEDLWQTIIHENKEIVQIISGEAFHIFLIPVTTSGEGYTIEINMKVWGDHSKYLCRFTCDTQTNITIMPKDHSLQYLDRYSKCSWELGFSRKPNLPFNLHFSWQNFDSKKEELTLQSYAEVRSSKRSLKV